MENQNQNDDVSLPSVGRILRSYPNPTALTDSQGLCPNTCLTWGIKFNSRYYPKGHNFIDGIRPPHNVSPQIMRILSSRMRAYIERPETYQSEMIDTTIIFCELDGVLADLKTGFKTLIKTDIDINKIPKRNVIHTIHQHPTFYESLPVIESGKWMWMKMISMNWGPVILTESYKSSTRSSKIKWCEDNLGPNYLVIDDIIERYTNPEYSYYILFSKTNTNINTTKKHLISNQHSVLIHNTDLYLDLDLNANATDLNAKDKDKTVNEDIDITGGLSLHYRDNFTLVDSERIVDLIKGVFDL
jgi:hypothetical protein